MQHLVIGLLRAVRIVTSLITPHGHRAADFKFVSTLVDISALAVPGTGF